MKIKYYKGIYRKNSQKWLGWSILDFYYNIHQNPSEKEEYILELLTENYFLIQDIKAI